MADLVQNEPTIESLIEEISKLKKDYDSLLKYKTIVNSLAKFPTGNLDEDLGGDNRINNEENSRFLKYKNFPTLDFDNKKNQYLYDLNNFLFEEITDDYEDEDDYDGDYHYKIIGWLDSKKKEFVPLENLADE